MLGSDSGENEERENRPRLHGRCLRASRRPRPRPELPAHRPPAPPAAARAPGPPAPPAAARRLRPRPRTPSPPSAPLVLQPAAHLRRRQPSAAARVPTPAAELRRCAAAAGARANLRPGAGPARRATAAPANRRGRAGGAAQWERRAWPAFFEAFGFPRNHFARRRRRPNGPRVFRGSFRGSRECPQEFPRAAGAVRRPRSRLGRMVGTRWRKSGQLGLRQGVRWRRSGLCGGWWVSAGRGRGRGGGLTAQVKAGMVGAPRSVLHTARSPRSVAPAPPPSLLVWPKFLELLWAS